MQTCEKLEGSRGLSFSNLQELEAWGGYFEELESQPPPVYWTSSLFNGEHWRDYYTGKLIDFGPEMVIFKD